MKLPLSWLREWVDLPLPPAELANRLTLRGFEIESQQSAAPPFSGVISARILSVEPHPEADKLRVCQVDAGGGVPLRVVCGAPNARPGLRVALAREGAELPGGVSIRRAKLRGVESQGMLCSARELGLAEDSMGLLELDESITPGQDLRQLLDLDDVIFEVAVTPNRGDAMSVLGVAREVAAMSGGALRAADAGEGRALVADAAVARWPVRLTPRAGCARFACAVIEGANNQCVSPQWLRARLQRCGLRSISPVVDVTNLVLLELGQPMHAYDRARLNGGIVVRAATTGEALTLLDGRDVELREDTLVIADGAGPVGLAGIMGGERTALSAATRDIVLEVAWFDPAAIAGRARRLGLLTDASQRFERGVDPALQERALRRAVALIVAIAGGKAGAIDVHELKAEVPARPPINLRSSQLQRLLGLQVQSDDVRHVLQSLGMAVAHSVGGWQVQPPSWRFDLAIEADLIEEVARSIGLDRIPEATPTLPFAVRGRSDRRLAPHAVTSLLTARGYSEVINYGFTAPELQRLLFGDVPMLALQNPIASNLAVMRASLWPGLLQSAAHNQRRQQPRCRLFEAATVFAADGSERAMLAGLATGSRWPEQWGAVATPVDYYDLKSDVQALLDLTGVGRLAQFVAAAGPPALHPGQCARIDCDGRAIGWIGSLHPTLQRSLDFTYPVTLFEIEREAIQNTTVVQYAPLSAFPSIRRDLSFTLPEGVCFSEIAGRVSVAARSRLQELRVFDIYHGKEVENGRKSVALGLILQDLSRTLSDADADQVVADVVDNLAKSLGAILRE